MKILTFWLDNRPAIKKSSLSYLCRLSMLLCLLMLGSGFLEAEQALSSENKIFLVFRNDDPSALSNVEHERKVMEFFQRYQIHQTMGVIPNIAQDGENSNCNEFHLLSKNQAMLGLLKKWHSEGLIEIALHGYTHQTNRLHPTKKKRLDNTETSGDAQKRTLYLPLNPEGHSEFRGLAYGEQLQRISQGKQLLESWFGAPVTTFILPWNSHDDNTIRAAKEARMELVSSYSDSFTTKLSNNFLFIQHTTGLDKFREVLTSARQFIKQSNKSVFIVLLYHSWMIQLPEEFQLLEGIVKEVSQSEDIVVLTLKELSSKFPETIKNAIPQKIEAQPYIQRAVKLLLLFKQKTHLFAHSGYVVLDSNYYIRKKAQAISLWRRFSLAVVGLASFFSIFCLYKLRMKRINKKLALSYIISSSLLWISLFLVGHFGIFGLDPKIGAIDSIVLIFVGVVVLWFIFGYFINILQLKRYNFNRGI